MEHIAVVDDSLPNLKAAEATLNGRYMVTLLTSGEQLLRFLHKKTPDLILLDINMPGLDGFETLSLIQSDTLIPYIPIIFLTASVDADNEIKGLKLGAVDFILKPFVAESMHSRIKLHLEINAYRKDLEGLVAEKTKTIEELQDAVSVSIAELVGCRDGYTGDHVKRTCNYIELLAQKLLLREVYPDQINAQYCGDLLRSAALHDVGKVGIKDEILCKPGSFTSNEFELMKQHTQLGGATLQKAIDQTEGESFLHIARDMALYHHEKWNGDGYLRALSGTDIPLCARIMAVVDVYDALTSKRPYKQPFTHETALNIISKDSGISFDPLITETFLMYADEFKSLLEKLSEETKQYDL